MTKSDWILPAANRSGSGPGRSTLPVRVSPNIGSTSSDGVKQIYTSVRLNKDLMKKLRWLIGDKVAVKIEDDCIMLKRHVKGFTLSPATGKNMKGIREKMLGKSEPSFMRFRHESVKIKESFECDYDEIECDDDILIIPIR